mmetsp:Transcript_27421/g.70485  ORF Transcript_27421/g.70485 Transcript_27421/m.70485 type:complete len:250 (-) Transcript_27421:628-1377(-)
MASKASMYLESASCGTGVSSSSGCMPTAVVLASTSPETAPDATSARLTASAPGIDFTNSRARSTLRLATLTVAPLWAAPKASALPAPPAPSTTTTLPCRLPAPPRPSSIALMAASQSVLYALRLPSGWRTSVLTAPMEDATGSTKSAFSRAASLWGIVTLKPAKSCALKAFRNEAMSSTSRGTYTPLKPIASIARLCSTGLRLCDTGLPTIPKTFVALSCTGARYRRRMSASVGCPGAEGRPSSAANVR